jgi:pyruvate carboxylase
MVLFVIITTGFNVDGADIDSMSGMTSQTSLGDLVSEFERTSLDFWFESSRFD